MSRAQAPAGAGGRRLHRAVLRAAARAAALAAVLAAAVSCGAGGATYTFRLVNRDTVALDSAWVADGEVEARFGPVAAGGEARTTVVVRRDVVLHLNGLRGERPLRFLLGGYVSRGPDAEVVLTLVPGDRLEVGAVTPR